MSNIETSIMLQSGRYFDLANPERCVCDIGDIAHALAHVCRFGGHAPRFYSVAEHSVLASFLVPDFMAWDALMHDCAEALLGDVVRPLKAMLPDYRAIEARVEARLASIFCFAFPMHRLVKDADAQMLALEQREILCNGDRWEATAGVDLARVAALLPVAPCGLEPFKARELFLARAEDLCRQRRD